jgi:hypothetical protein
MGYGRAISKAVKQAGKQQQANTRGLSGNRNAQGDFMTGENQLDTDRFAASEMMARDKITDSVTPDIQNYIDDVKAQIDEIDEQLSDIDTNVDTPGMSEEIKRLENEKFALIEETLERLESEGIEPPEALIRMKTEMYNPKAYDGYN